MYELMWTKKSVGVACLTHLIMMALYFSDLMFIYVLFSASSYFLHPELFPSHCFNQPLYFLYVLFIRYFFGLLPSMLIFVKIVYQLYKVIRMFLQYCGVRLYFFLHGWGYGQGLREKLDRCN